MSTLEQFSFDPSAFCGVVRLFPLPNLVMFPHVVQPLHIFEPRYRRLMEDALAGDGLIAMAVLGPGWEASYEGRPPLESIACLGRIATHVRLDDGRFNLLLLGLRRVRLLEELPPSELYRRARVEVLEDVYAAAQASQRQALQSRLLDALKQRVASISAAHEQLDHLLSGQHALGTLTDVVGYTLDFDAAFKLRLLGEVDVDRRAAMLLEQLKPSDPSHSGLDRRRFPPDFSRN